MKDESTIRIVPFEAAHGERLVDPLGVRLAPEHIQALKKAITCSLFDKDEFVGCISVGIKDMVGAVWIFLDQSRCSAAASRIREFLTVTAELNQLSKLETPIPRGDIVRRAFLEELGFQYDRDFPGPWSVDGEHVMMVGYEKSQSRSGR